MSGRGDEPLGSLLYGASSLLAAEIAETVLKPRKLSFPQYVCLRILANTPGKTNAELARSLHTSPQLMHTVLRALEDRRLVARPVSATSGRSLPAELTRDGTEFFAAMDAEVRIAEERALVDLTDAQRRELRRLLTKIR